MADTTKGKIKVQVQESDEAVYWELARDMFDTIEAGNAAGRKTVMIVPVGPVAHYRWLAHMVNRAGLSLKDVWFINMDEYLTDADEYIPENDPLSFRGFMKRGVHGLVKPELRMPEEQDIFPQPGNEENISRVIAQLGGVDVCYGGMGINGHIAFNEPPEGEMSAKAFAALPTRVLNVSCATRTINAVGNTLGDIDAIPRRCITIGMKDILGARRINIMMTRQWQKAVFKKAVYGPVTAQVPGSLLQTHPDATLTVAPWVADEGAAALI